MIPGEPGQLGTVRGEPRGRVEFVSGDEDLTLALLLWIKADDGVDRLWSLESMVFAYRDYAVSLLVEYAIRVSHVDWRCQRPRVTRRVLAVETLVGIVGKVDCSVLDEVASTPVLMNSRSGAEAWRGNIRQRAIWFSLDNYVPALVGWSKLVPVN